MAFEKETKMSRLTFIGWLKLELMRMSGSKSVSIHKLAALAQEDNSRLAEPLLLYAMETNAAPRLMAYIKDERLIEEYQLVQEICGERSILDLEKEQGSQLPWSYQKLLANWDAAEMKSENIEKSKQMRLERSLQLKAEKGVSNAQIYRALNLNRGNTNAYFKHGDASKLSLENATRIMKYLFSL